MSAPSSAIQSTLIENRVFEPSAATVAAARIGGMAAYQALCAEADKDPEGFWSRLARENLSWHTPFTKTLDDSNAPFFKWFEDGTLNVSWNCLDRQVAAGNNIINDRWQRAANKGKSCRSFIIPQ